MITLYFPFFFFSFVFAILHYHIKLKSLSIVLGFFLVILISWLPAFGGSMMQDYHVYWASYDALTIADFSVSSITDKIYSLEFGFAFLMFIGKTIGLSFVGFFFFIALFENSLILSYVKTDKYPVLSCMTFLLGVYYLQEANAIRQLCAISLLLFSIRYILEKNIWKYAILIFLASLIHQSAILFFPTYFLLKKSQIKQVLLCIWGISFVLFLINLKLDLSFVFSYLNGNDSSYAIYGDYEVSQTIIDRQLILTYNLLQIFVCYVLIFFKLEDDDKLKLLIFTIGIIILNLVPSLPILHRLSWYYVVFFMSLPSILTYNFNVNKHRILGNAILIVFILFNFKIFIAKSLSQTMKGGLGVKILDFSDMFI